MNIFVNDADLMEIAFFAGEKEGKLVVFSDEEKIKEAVGNSSYEKNIVWIRKPTYGSNRKASESSITREGDNVRFDPIKYRFERVFGCIKKWTLKDASGNVAPLTQNMFDLLPENVGALIIELIEAKIN
jgi:hypothetical protein